MAAQILAGAPLAAALLLESVSDAVVVVDLDWHVQQWNPAAEQLYGCPADEVLGRPLHDVIPLLRSDGSPVEIQQALDQQSVWRGQVVQRHRDGHDLLVAATFHVLRDPQGLAVGYLAIQRDLSDQLHLEQERAGLLRQAPPAAEPADASDDARLDAASSETQALLDALYTNAPVGLAFVNRDLRFVRVNATLAEINGIPAADHLGRSLSETRPQIAPVVEPIYRRVLATGQPVVNVEISGETVSCPGVLRTFLASYYPVQLPDGSLAGVGIVVIEISEQKRAEEALRQLFQELEQRVVQRTAELAEANAQLRATGRMARIGGWSYDPAAQTVRLSDDLYQIYDLPADMEPNLDQLRTCFSAEAWARLCLGNQAALASGTPYDLELPLVSLKGQACWVRVQGQPRFVDGCAVAVAGAMQDITVRKEAELALQARERAERVQLQRILDYIPVMIALVGSDGNVQWINQAFEQTLGWTLHEAQTTSCMASLYPDPAERAAGAAFFHAATGEWRDFQTTIRSGQVLDTTWANIRLDDGAIMVIGLDISARKVAERTLLESEQRVRAIIAQAPVAILMVRDTLIVDLNPAACALFGFASPTDAIGREAIEYVALDDRPLVTGYRAQREAGLDPPTSYEIQGRRVDGSTFLALVQVTRVELVDGPVTVIFYSDLTARQQAEVARGVMERQVQELRKLESLVRMAGGIAHDFNNLLAVMLGNLELLGTELCGMAEADLVEATRQAAQRAAILTRQMQTFAGGGQRLSQQVDLGAWLRQQSGLFRQHVPAQIGLRLVVPPDLPQITADLAQIEEALQQLVTNAVEAIGTAAGTISIEIEACSADYAVFQQAYLAPDLPAGNYVALTVRDNGSGMDAFTQAHLFEPFFSTRFMGRGLGLAAVLGIVQGHQGAIRVVSSPGHGTSMTILLPALTLALPAKARHAQPAPVEVAAAGLVLVVDDEAPVRTLAQRMLARSGYQSLLAADGNAALDLLRAHQGQIACALLDLTMPGLGGDDLYAAMRTLDVRLPIAIMSGHTEVEVRARFAGAAIAGFLAKPFTMKALQALMQTLIAGPS